MIKNVKLQHFGKKTLHFGKITAFDENHSFRVSVIFYCP